jgi:outer membrane protein TolC
MKTSDLGDETAVGYVAGVAISIPVFDHGQADRDRALAEKEALAAEVRSLERLVSISVRNSYEGLSRRIVQAAQYQRTQLPRLDELLRRTELSYQEGERPIFELLDAYRTAREIRLRDAELRRAAKGSELELLRALGQRPITEAKR